MDHLDAINDAVNYALSNIKEARARFSSVTTPDEADAVSGLLSEAADTLSSVAEDFAKEATRMEGEDV